MSINELHNDSKLLISFMFLTFFCQFFFIKYGNSYICDRSVLLIT